MLVARKMRAGAIKGDSSKLNSYGDRPCIAPIIAACTMTCELADENYAPKTLVGI